MDPLSTDLIKTMQAEYSSDPISEALNRGELVSSDEIDAWLRQQDPLNEVTALETIAAMSILSKQLLKEAVTRRRLRMQTFRTAGYLTVMRACLPAGIQEGSAEELEALIALQKRANAYYDQKSPQEKDTSMSSQDVAIFAMINGEVRTDEASTKLLVMSTHLIYDALTDSTDMVQAKESYRQTITHKDGIILDTIGKELHARLSDLLQSGNIDAAFSAAQSVMMVDSYYLNQYSHPTVKSQIESSKLARVFLGLKATIDTMLPFVDAQNPRQLGKLYEMVWLYNAHALKLGLGKDRLSIWPTNMAKDEPYIGKPKKKRNVDILLLGDNTDNRTVRIQLKARTANRHKAKKTKHPDVHISPDGEDFDEAFVATLPGHLHDITRAALSKNRRLLRATVLDTVQESFREYDQTSQTTLNVGAGVLAFVKDNPRLKIGLQRTQKEKPRAPNRAQRRANAPKKR